MTDQRGFSLIEVLVAMLILSMAVLAAIPLFIQAGRSIASSGEIGTLGAVASQRMEQLRATAFDTLTAGGDVDTNVSGFVDQSDPGLLLRWEIVDDATPPTMKTIRVWAQAANAPVGQQKELLIVGVAAQ